MAATLKDIARTAGLSVPTVSDILNRGRAGIYNADTCKHVLAVSHRLDYRPHRSAQAMRSNRTRVIGFAAVNIANNGMLDNQNIYPFLVGLNKRLSEDNFRVGMVELTELEDPTGMPQALRERFFDALVLHYGLSSEAIAMAGRVGLPVVWWDSGVFTSHGCVYRDETAVSNQLMDRLLAMGHRRIAYMAGRDNWACYQAGKYVHYSYRERFETYRARMKAAGMPPMPLVGYESESLAQQIKRYAPTAVVIQGGVSAALSDALAILGWRPGHDISVATLDREARVYSRGVSIGGMLYDRYDAGRHAAELVLSQLQSGKPAASIRLEGNFDLGDTMIPPPAGSSLAHA